MKHSPLFVVLPQLGDAEGLIILMLPRLHCRIAWTPLHRLVPLVDVGPKFQLVVALDFVGDHRLDHLLLEGTDIVQVLSMALQLALLLDYLQTRGCI